MLRRGSSTSKLLRRLIYCSNQRQRALKHGAAITVSTYPNDSSLHVRDWHCSAICDKHSSLTSDLFSFPVVRRHYNCAVTADELEVSGLGKNAFLEEKMGKLLSLLNELQQDDSFESRLDLIFADVNDLGEDFMTKVIKSVSTNRLARNLVRFFSWAIGHEKLHAKRGLTPAIIDLMARNSLKKSTTPSLWPIVKQCAQDMKIMPANIGTFRRFLFNFSLLGKGNDIIDAFNKISEFGLVPDSDCYYYAIVGLCKSSDYDTAWNICQKMIEDDVLPENPKKLGAIIHLLCKANKVSDAYSFYTVCKSLSKFPPWVDFSKLVSCLSQNDESVGLAATMLDDIPEQDLKMACKPFSYVVRGLCRIQDADAASELLKKMINKGPPPGNDAFNRIVASYSKLGNMEASMETMKLMESRGLKPDVFTYTVIISGYVRLGHMSQAREILSIAKEKHAKLTPVTYHSLIRGHCKLEQFEDALELLREMKNFGVLPNAHEYGKLIQSLCIKALDWETSEKLLKEMEDGGLHLTASNKSLIEAVKRLKEEGVEEVPA